MPAADCADDTDFRNEPEYRNQNKKDQRQPEPESWHVRDIRDFWKRVNRLRTRESKWLVSEHDLAGCVLNSKA